jgi:hypothetical protein
MEPISVSIKQLIFVLGGWTVVIVGIVSWAGKLIADRIALAWRRNEQSAIEAVRHAFSSERILLESIIKGSQLGQDSSHERRLIAIERMWQAVLILRSRFSCITFFYGILLPEEYDDTYRRGGAIGASIRDVNDESTVNAMNEVESVENERPYLGEVLWLKFFIYRAFLGRLSVLIIKGKETGRFQDWREDNGVRQLLPNVLKPEVIDAILNRLPSFVSVTRATAELENSILEETSLILSGGRSAIESFQNATELREAVTRYSQGAQGSAGCAPLTR